MTNSADLDQLASSEANWSGSTWIYTVSKGRVYLGSPGAALMFMLWEVKYCLWKLKNKLLIFFCFDFLSWGLRKLNTLGKSFFLFNKGDFFMTSHFTLSPEKSSTLKGKNLLLKGVKSFLLEWTLFQKVVEQNSDSCFPWKYINSP